MALVDLVRDASLLNDSAADWGFLAAELGEELERELCDPTSLLSVARQIAEIAAGDDCDAVVGASEVGDRLAGAVVAVANNGLRICAPGDSGRRVLVLDGLLASGVRLARAATEIRAAGNDVPRAAVILVAGHPAPTVVGSDLELSIVAEELASSR